MTTPPAGSGQPEPESAESGEPSADGSSPTKPEPSASTEGAASSRPSFLRRRTSEPKPRRKAPWWELPALILLAIGIAILVKSFVVQPFYIPSDSMENTLAGSSRLGHDRILVNKPIYTVLRDPEPGDIVVFDAPPGWDDETPRAESGNVVTRAVRGFGQLVGFVPPDGQVLVKRVIAGGGQTVKGDAQGHVMISDNGAGGPYRTLREPYVYTPSTDQGQQPFGPVTVPKGRLWVMGDHRTDSADSRYHCTPGVEGTQNDLNCNATSATVPVDDVIGKAFVVAWPPSRWDILGTPKTFEHSSAAAAPVLPTAAGLAVTVPMLVVRRRRRSGSPGRLRRRG